MSVLRRPWAVALPLLVVLPLFVLLSPTPAYAAGTVTVSVVGQGSVTGDGIDCTQTGGPDCSEFYPNEPEGCIGDPPHQTCFDPPPTRELTAAPDSNGFVFSSFQGCDSVSARVCTITVSNNRSVTAVYSDAQAPTVVLTGPLTATIRGTVSMTANASDNNGVKRVEFRMNGSLLGSDTTAPYSLNLNTTSFPDGTRTISARAVDLVENASLESSRSVTIDNTAPVLSVTGPDGATFGPGSTQTWNMTASDATSGLSSRICSVVPENTPPTFGACSGVSSHQVTGLAGGSYVFTARVVDGAGNTTTAAPRTFTIDATPPTSMIVSGPAHGSVTASRTATFAMTASEPGSTFGCRAYAFGTTPPAFGACSGGTQHVLTGLADGGHTFEVRATDAVGNVEATPVTRAFVVDGTAPQTSFTKTPKKVIRTTKRKVTVRFGLAASEAGTFRCSLDGKAWVACAAATSFKVKRGRHTLRVVATDAVGNVDASPATYSWRVKKKV